MTEPGATIAGGDAPEEVSRASGVAAVIVSAVVSAALWTTVLGVDRKSFRTAILDSISKPVQHFVGSYFGLLLLLYPIAIIVAIVMDNDAGHRGKRNRSLGIIGGVVLLSSLASFAVVEVLPR